MRAMMVHGSHGVKELHFIKFVMLGDTEYIDCLQKRSTACSPYNVIATEREVWQDV